MKAHNQHPRKLNDSAGMIKNTILFDGTMNPKPTPSVSKRKCLEPVWQPLESAGLGSSIVF